VVVSDPYATVCTPVNSTGANDLDGGGGGGVQDERERCGGWLGQNNDGSLKNSAAGGAGGAGGGGVYLSRTKGCCYPEAGRVWVYSRDPQTGKFAEDPGFDPSPARTGLSSTKQATPPSALRWEIHPRANTKWHSASSPLSACTLAPGSDADGACAVDAAGTACVAVEGSEVGKTTTCTRWSRKEAQGSTGASIGAGGAHSDTSASGNGLVDPEGVESWEVPKPVAFQHFGWSMDVSDDGTVLVVGSNAGPDVPGSAYVFTR
jgi:hypothetical protein